MRNVTRPLTFLARRLGVAGLTALGLIAIAAWGEWLSVPEIEQDIADLQRQIHVLPASKLVIGHGAKPSEALAAVYGLLAQSDGANEVLASLLEQARIAGISVDAVQYRIHPDLLPGVWRHEVDFPLKGRYGVLRNWLTISLQSRPSLSLDALTLKRSDAQSDIVEARVSMSLWVNEISKAEVPIGKKTPDSASSDTRDRLAASPGRGGL